MPTMAGKDILMEGEFFGFIDIFFGFYRFIFVFLQIRIQDRNCDSF